MPTKSQGRYQSPCKWMLYIGPAPAVPLMNGFWVHTFWVNLLRQVGILNMQPWTCAALGLEAVVKWDRILQFCSSVPWKDFHPGGVAHCPSPGQAGSLEGCWVDQGTAPASDGVVNSIATIKHLYWHSFTGCVRRQGWKASLTEDVSSSPQKRYVQLHTNLSKQLRLFNCAVLRFWEAVGWRIWLKCSQLCLTVTGCKDI